MGLESRHTDVMKDVDKAKAEGMCKKDLLQLIDDRIDLSQELLLGLMDLKDYFRKGLYDELMGIHTRNIFACCIIEFDL